MKGDSEMKRMVGSFVLFIVILVSLTGCADKKKEVIFADAGWDSVKFHSAIAGFIAETAYGFDEWREISGTSTVLHEGLIKGEVDVHMEEWTDNLATYKDDLKAGKLKEWGVNFDDNMQGLYVPRYVIEGDEEREIKAVAPGLKTVQDLQQYKDVFLDDEEKDKGRIYGAIPGWEIDKIMYNKYLYNELDKDFIYFRPGSEAAMNAAFTAAYEKGEPIVGYYWEPTWLLGKYDFVLLEDNSYTNDEDFKAGITECPSIVITITSSNQFAEEYPEYTEFLSKYSSTSELTSEALAHMQDTGDDHLETAKWYMQKYDAFLDDWLDDEKAQLVRDALRRD